MSQMIFEQLYPDVLGAISGGTRANIDALQCALGVFPRQAFLNQPVEAVLLVQNMIDQPLQVRVSINLPPQDKNGNTLVLDTPRQVIPFDMAAGEVGALRIPIIAYPPTQPGTDIPFHVAVRSRSARQGRLIRARAGGAPPTNIPVSPFKLQALREIEFGSETWSGSSDILSATFDIAPRRLPPGQYSLTARYETFWTADEMQRERERVTAKIEEARELAGAMTTTNLFWPMIYATEDHFAACNLPLYPGEIKAIGKMMTYTMSEATVLERENKLENTRWFQALCHLLAEKPELAYAEVGALAAEHLYQHGIYDSVMLAFRLLQTRVSEDLGNLEERMSYAENVVSWFVGQSTPDIHYAYLPLALAGVIINMIVGATIEHPSIMLKEIQEAAEQRRRHVHGDMAVIFQMFDKVFKAAEREASRMTPLRS
jgi:hypothetical protein